MKKSWSVINDALGRKSVPLTVSELRVADEEISDAPSIVNHFDNHFFDIGQTLSNSFEPPNSYNILVNKMQIFRALSICF